jgi:hypothetical protein
MERLGDSVEATARKIADWLFDLDLIKDKFLKKNLNTLTA